MNGKLNNFGRIYPQTQELIGWDSSGKVKRGDNEGEGHSHEIFPYAARQPCQDLFLRIKYRDKKLLHGQMERQSFGDSHRGPYPSQNDFGVCCSFHPDLDFREADDRKAQAEGLGKGVEYVVGEGLEFMIDIEAFNYGHPLVPTEV